MAASALCGSALAPRFRLCGCHTQPPRAAAREMQVCAPHGSGKLAPPVPQPVYLLATSAFGHVCLFLLFLPPTQGFGIAKSWNEDRFGSWANKYFATDFMTVLPSGACTFVRSAAVVSLGGAVTMLNFNHGLLERQASSSTWRSGSCSW